MVDYSVYVGIKFLGNLSALNLQDAKDRAQTVYGYSSDLLDFRTVADQKKRPGPKPSNRAVAKSTPVSLYPVDVMLAKAIGGEGGFSAGVQMALRSYALQVRTRGRLERSELGRQALRALADLRELRDRELLRKQGLDAEEIACWIKAKYEEKK
jgi:hypothetical protein